jgi:lysophospholipase L1-like esterase
MFKNFLKSILSIVISTLVLFGVLEWLARVVYPEFKGQIHSVTKTLGVNYFLAEPVPIRTPFKNAPIEFDKPLVIVLGDSISHGYGMAYEDIYWVRLERMVQLALGKQAPEFISLSYYGNDLQDSIVQLDKFLSQHDKASVKEIIYQFNFNDIVPEAYGRQALQATYKRAVNITPATTPSQATTPSTAPVITASDPHALSASSTTSFPVSSTTWSKTFAAWRSEYLNYSVFLRVAQHFAGKITRNTSGDCIARELNALGPYTWTYGSQKYAVESEKLWDNFSIALGQLKNQADAKGAKLTVLVSPLLFDVDTVGAHPQYNYLNYDFTCATINPRARLANIARKLGVTLLDPTAFIKQSFDSRTREGNFTPFFFTADENHITPVAASLMADYLYATEFKLPKD